MARRDDREDLSPYLAVMRQAGRPARIIPFPGVEGARVALWIPTDAEETEADAEARKYLTSVLKLDALQLSLAVESDLHRREKELELLSRVMRDPRDPSQAFCSSVDDLRDPEHGLTRAQREALMASLKDFEVERFSPRVPEDDDRLAGILRDLKASGGLSEFWTGCDGDTLRSIAQSLARLVLR